MRIRTLALSALPGLCALTLACSDGEAPPTEPAAPDAPAAGEAVGPALSLFGLGIPGLACRSAPYRQFDFWLGTWEITAALPTKGASFITSGVGGCAVFENYYGAVPPNQPGGQRGRSLNVYDASDRQWHQHWVENSGFYPLRLDGGIRMGAMVMQGSYPDPIGTPKVFTDRYTWTRLGPDDVRQFVEQSTDGGVTFPAATFDGHYHRTSNPAIPVPRVYVSCTTTDPTYSLFQEFRFTLGRWKVEVDGPGVLGAIISHRHPAESEISTDMDGCLTEEKLTGPLGYEARVFTNIRPLDEIWQRTYVDNRGLRIYLTGPRIQDGAIVLTGSMPKLGGGTQQVRATFKQADPTHFVQRWERAERHGWKPLVTATYTRR